MFAGIIAAAMLFQSGHTVALTLIPPPGISGGNFNFYRASANCSPVPAAGQFTSVGNVASTVTTLVDNNVPLGPQCYYATYILNGMESPPSPMAQVTVVNSQPSPPGFTAVQTK